MGALAAGDFVGVENGGHLSARRAPVITKPVHQRIPRRTEILPRKLEELRPGIYQIVAVDKDPRRHSRFPSFCRLSRCTTGRSAGFSGHILILTALHAPDLIPEIPPGSRQRVTLDGTVSALKNGF